MSQQFSLRRMLALLVLPASLFPVLMLSPSLVRAPATLWRRIDPPGPAHVVRAPPAPRPLRLLIGAARFEVDAFEPLAGALTPKVGVSPLAPPRPRVLREARIR
jgi:hypothetical protein